MQFCSPRYRKDGGGAEMVYQNVALIGGLEVRRQIVFSGMLDVAG